MDFLKPQRTKKASKNKDYWHGVMNYQSWILVFTVLGLKGQTPKQIFHGHLLLQNSFMHSDL